MFKNILAATAFPSLLDEAVATAAKLCVQNKSLLHIIHVLDPEISDESRRAPANEKIIREISNTYHQFLRPELPTDIQVRNGIPWQEIIRFSREKKVDLIILGPPEIPTEISDKQKKIGSTIENILKKEPSPVMIVNRQVSDRMIHFKNIMIGVDFSGSCACAVRFAGKFFENYHSNLYLFHMLPVPPQPEFSMEDYHRNKIKAMKNLTDFGHILLEEIPFEKIVIGGNAPHREIVRYSEENAMDLIIMGSHTKSDGSKWYVGSAVERVSKRSHCPVIVITDPSVIQEWEE